MAGCSGASTDEINGLTGTSQLNRGNADSCIWGGTTPGISPHQWTTCRKMARQKKTCGAWWTASWTEPAMHPSCKGRWWYPDDILIPMMDALSKVLPADQESRSFPSAPGETSPGVGWAIWAPLCTRDIDILERILRRGTKTIGV